MFKSIRKEMITIPAQMSYLSQIRDFISQIGKQHKFSDKIINSFKLVVDEACTNIIRHGYRDIKGGEITVKAIIRRQSLTIVLIDQGTSYDPRQASTPDLENYIRIGKKGGLGILMMRKLMDDVQYNITSRGNELRFTKQREIIPQSQPRLIWENLSMRSRYTLVASTVITILVGIVFTFLYLRVDKNSLNDVIENSRSQILSLAENSSYNLEQDNSLELFELVKAYKANNPGIIYDAFITDSLNKIVARSMEISKIRGLGVHQYPDNMISMDDTTKYYKLYRYILDDTLNLYDFVAEIHSKISTEDLLIGYGHIWVLNDYIINEAITSKRNIILFIIVLLLISYLGSYFLIDRIVTPFHSLADWVREVGKGNVDDDEIDIDASDELGEIAQAFNQMTNKFREAQVDLIEQQRLRKELQVAQEIQQMLLPSDFPQVEGYEIASFYEAAKEVGGDLFDFVEVDEDTVGICIADVSGKGIPGSLIMTMIRTALRLEARGNKNPADVLARVNRFVTDDMKRGMFVTMFYLVLDSRNRIIHYASAGHNPMILYRGSSKQTYYLNPPGFPVGIQLPDITLFDRKILQDSIRLKEDDLLVLYTDGITEAMNPQRELYHEERFLDAIRNNAHYDISEFIKRVKDNVKEHTKNFPQNDDITYVAIKEKLMPNEIIYTIHRELFRLIEEDGYSIKDACIKMRVSPYMYRKYKKIKDSMGLEGLKELLNQTDYIEKRHLSIEVKTKIFDIIKNNPEYGAQKISNELNTEKYGFAKINSRRIYLELKLAKLNTKEQRENFIKRGGKKRYKMPGTPLLTLDGKVILNYQSPEEVIGAEDEKQEMINKTGTWKEENQKEIKKDKVNYAAGKQREISSRSSDKQKGKIIYSEEEKQAENESRLTEKAIEEKSKPKTEAKTSPKEIFLEKELKEAEEIEISDDDSQQVSKDITSYTTRELKEKQTVTESLVRDTTIEKDKKDDNVLTVNERLSKKKIKQRARKKVTKKKEKEKKVKKVITEKITVDQEITDNIKQKRTVIVEQDIVKEPLISPQEKEDNQDVFISSFEIDSEEFDHAIVNNLYLTIKDDIDIIHHIIKSWDNKDYMNDDVNKILLTLKIVYRNPYLIQLGIVRQLFEQVIRAIEFFTNNADSLNSDQIVQNIKEILKYIEKENILTSSSELIHEQINEIGVKYLQFYQKINNKYVKHNLEFEKVRKKIAKKNILKNHTFLENYTKSIKE
jgi:serine phosphatase RsbU (regulator of sigma subunit)/anti-sigma regulatory factor (Ser/Thr protein kinase)